MSRRLAAVLGVGLVIAVIAAAIAVPKIRESRELARRADLLRAMGVGACVEYPVNATIDPHRPEFAEVHEVECSQPHVFQILGMGSDDAAIRACSADEPRTNADRYRNILTTVTTQVGNDLYLCIGSQVFADSDSRVIGSFLDGTASPVDE